MTKKIYMDARPIGFYDSSSGGLSIWKSVTTLLPDESTVYIGDHRYAPYSTKTLEEIRDRGISCIRFLLSKNVKLIVVACNTATVAGIDDFRKTFPDIPIVGVVPVVKTAARETKTKKFAILSTEFTAKSPYQQTLIKTFASDCDVTALGNTELVTLIESGKKDTEYTKQLLATILTPVLGKGIDILVLGCTHFPFLKNSIQEIVGTNIKILDSGDAVGRHVKHILESENLQAPDQSPRYEFFTTGEVEKVRVIIENLLGGASVVVQSA